jgi:hypothetical protein
MLGGAGTEIIIGAGFLLVCAVCGLCIAANVIARMAERLDRYPPQNPFDGPPYGDWPHIPFTSEGE